MAAMRLGTHGDRPRKIVVFNGDYHGQFDEVLVKGVQRAGAAPRSMPVAPGIPALRRREHGRAGICHAGTLAVAPR